MTLVIDGQRIETPGMETISWLDDPKVPRVKDGRRRVPQSARAIVLHTVHGKLGPLSDVPSVPSARAERLRASAVGKCRSATTARSAPRLIASKARAPVPAKRSIAKAPLTSMPSRSKRLSRTRSFMGRVRAAGANSSSRCLRVPPTQVWRPAQATVRVDGRE